MQVLMVQVVESSSTDSWIPALVTMVGVGLLMVGAGVLVIGIARRTADGRLGRNSLAGTRTKTTMASDESWLAAHQAGRPLTEWGGRVAALSGPLAVAAGLLLGRESPGQAMAWFGSTLIALTIVFVGLVVAGALKGQRAAKP